MKVIYHDPATGMLTILSKLDPGSGIPEHVHEDLEQTYVLEGSLVDDEGECTAGNFVIRAKGSRYASTARHGCTILVFFLKPTAGLKKVWAGLPLLDRTDLRPATYSMTSSARASSNAQCRAPASHAILRDCFLHDITA